MVSPCWTSIHQRRSLRTKTGGVSVLSTRSSGIAQLIAFDEACNTVIENQGIDRQQPAVATDPHLPDELAGLVLLHCLGQQLYLGEERGKGRRFGHAATEST